MDHETQAFEAAAWAVTEGHASAEQLALLEGDPDGTRRTFERLLDEVEANLDAVLETDGPEREMAIADLDGELDRLEAAYDRFHPRPIEPEPEPEPD
ncbi:MAG: hypothetical protein QOJ09_1149, partial [Actinomycetota bacterium]|nr:hypothetical protein [Actinomycetota bacterium]